MGFSAVLRVVLLPMKQEMEFSVKVERGASSSVLKIFSIILRGFSGEITTVTSLWCLQMVFPICEINVMAVEDTRWQPGKQKSLFLM